MSDEVFNFTLDVPFEEEIEYLTLVSESEAGKEQRYQKWLRPRRIFRVRLDARNAADSDTIWRFYTARKGNFDTFLFQSPNENPVTAERFGSGDGIQTVFYLGSKVDVGTGDLILTPSSLAVTRSIAGTGDFLSFTAYTVNEAIGKVTTNSALPSGDVLRANYNFRYRVRFKEPSLSRELFINNLYRFGAELIEVI